jgi:hypothetical protein
MTPRTLSDGAQECDENRPAWIADAKKHRPQSRGLGDTIERILDAARIGPVAKKVITRITGKPCGCERRRDLLNRLVPYTKRQLALVPKDETE